MIFIILKINGWLKKPILTFVLTFLLGPFSSFSQKDCNSNNSEFLPITDLGSQYFRGYQGGLFSGGINIPAGIHASDLLRLNDSIVALDTYGQPKIDGKIIMIGVGASNPRTEFDAFVNQARNLKTLNKSLDFVNTCIGGQGIQKMNDANDNYWKQAMHTFDSIGYSPLQVQIAWIETENTAASDTAFPRAPQALEVELHTLLTTLLIKFPNLKICYFSPRAYSGFAIPIQGGVGKGLLYPRDYYNGWAGKWFIQNIIDRKPGYSFEGPNKQIPYCTFGSYHWTNGSAIRLDSFAINCDLDIGGDGLHLTELGENKIGGQILNFFENDELASQWFLQQLDGMSVKGMFNKSKVVVFPNPLVDGVLNLKLTQIYGSELKISLRDISGKQVFESTVTNSELEIRILLPELANGFYCLLISNEGETILCEKIIK